MKYKLQKDKAKGKNMIETLNKIKERIINSSFSEERKILELKKVDILKSNFL